MNTSALNLLSIGLSVSLVIVNKCVLENINDPLYGLLLVPLHLFCTTVVTAVSGITTKGQIPRNWLFFNAVVVLCSLYGSLLVLKFSTVSFQQVGKLLCVPISVFVDRYFWCEGTLGPSKIVCIVGICFGVLMVSSDVQEVPLSAFVSNLFAAGGQVASQTCVKLISKRFGATSSDFLKQAAPYTFAISFLFNCSVLFCRFSMKAGNIGFPVSFALSRTSVVLLSVSCCLGVLVQYCTAMLSQVSSAVAYSLLSVTKSICTIMAGALVFTEQASCTKSLGLIVSLTMFFRYLNSKEGLSCSNNIFHSATSNTEFRTNLGIMVVCTITWAIALHFGAAPETTASVESSFNVAVTRNASDV